MEDIDSFKSVHARINRDTATKYPLNTCGDHVAAGTGARKEIPEKMGLASGNKWAPAGIRAHGVETHQAGPPACAHAWQEHGADPGRCNPRLGRQHETVNTSRNPCPQHSFHGPRTSPQALFFFLIMRSRKSQTKRQASALHACQSPRA